MSKTLEKVTLYYRDAGSDKVYQAELSEVDDGRHVVMCAWGRRGGTFQTAVKPTAPTNLEKAKTLYDKVVSEKMAKGYSPGDDGTAYQFTDKEKEFTGLVPQLLNECSEEEVQRLLANDAWGLQEKMDGKHLLVQLKDGVVTGINRRGLTCGIPQTVVDSVKMFGHDILLDGEGIGDDLYVFDILEASCTALERREPHHIDLRKSWYTERWCVLSKFVYKMGPNVKLVDLYVGTKDKRENYARMQKAGCEGVVLKDLSALSSPGRPATGGSMLKFKFYETQSFVVTDVNDKRSVRLGCVNVEGGVNGIVFVGSCSIPVNKDVPKKGDVVEVRYLYYYGGGAVYQPVYVGVRDDMEWGDCQLSKLKRKKEEQ